jgi:hypothetical protein
VRAGLEALSDQLTTLWSSALERGDFEEITRLVEAGHAIRRAALALSADSLLTLSQTAPTTGQDRPPLAAPDTAA